MVPRGNRCWTRSSSGHVSLRALLGVVLSLALGACDRSPRADYSPQASAEPPHPSNRIEYSFGVPPLYNAVRFFDIYQPLIDELNHSISEFALRLETARDYPSYEIKVREAKLHFAMLNPHLVIAAEDCGYHIIGRTADKIWGLVVVRQDANVRRVADLKSASISFGARTDLAGTMMPKVFLKQAGLNVETQANIKYVGSQDSALMNVHLGLSAAACVSASGWNTFRKLHPDIAQTLQIRWQTDPLVGLGLLTRNDVPREHVATLTRVLFELQATPRGPEILEAMKVSGVRAAEAGTYDGVWEFLNDYRRMFGRTPTLGGAE